MRAKWTAVAAAVTEETAVTVDARVCESKWTNLKKDYATWVADQTQTGAGRKDFPNSDILYDMLKDGPVVPVVLGTQTGVQEDQ